MIDWFDPSDDVVIRPEIDRARFWRRKFGQDRIEIASNVLFVNNGHGRLFDAVCAAMDEIADARFDFRQSGYCHYQCRGSQITVYRAAEPAPYAVGDLEHLMSAGADQLIFINGSGSLCADIPVGSILLPEDIIREEGTSFHYAPPGLIRTDPRLNVKIQQAAARLEISLIGGKHWTTDAIYRETWTKVDHYRSIGVNSVDMELSALAAAASFRQRCLSAILVVTDVCVKDHSWEGTSSAAFLLGVQNAARLAAHVFDPLQPGKISIKDADERLSDSK